MSECMRACAMLCSCMCVFVERGIEGEGEFELHYILSSISKRDSFPIL